MKTYGIDHVGIIVKDMYKAVEFFSKLFELEFEEIPFLQEESGIRISASLPDGQIELFSVVDRVKAEKSNPKIAEIAGGGYEGLYNLALRVKDAGEAITDAERMGVRIARVVEGKPLGTFLPHPWKEVILNEEDMPVKRINVMWRDTR